MKVWIFNLVIILLMGFTLYDERVLGGIYGITWATLIMNTVLLFIVDRKLNKGNVSAKP